MASINQESSVESVDVEYNDLLTGDYLSLCTHTIDIETNVNKCRVPRAGAVSIFLGTTRDFFEEKNVSYLAYEAYPEMAIECMKEIVNQIRLKWSIQRVVCVHKLGDCPIGEISVLIAVSSEHRVESLAAVEFAINELKRTVPIWKKEHYDDNDSTWKQNKEAED